MTDSLSNDAAAIASRLIGWRRDFHRRPETAFKEFETSAVLKKFFEDLGCPVRTLAGTGLLADLEGRPGGRTVALRTDMDALPLTEEPGKPYGSENPGACHACGHDGHMAIMMGAAELLSRRKSRWTGRVVFLGQPAEELPPGGAKPMIEQGALDGVDAVFGLHLWQGMPTGKVALVKGPMMAQSDNFRIVVRGRGGHGSMPHAAVDPILAAAQIVTAAQGIVSRNVDPLKPAVLTFGTIHGGTVYNIIPNEVLLTGTVRTFDPGLQKLIERRLRETAADTARAFGASAELEYEIGYPPLVNDPASVDFVTGIVRRTFGADRLLAIDPVMGGEDFAYYLQNRPGAFLFFGAGDGTSAPHHHPAFDIDERALPEAAQLLASIALEFLGGVA
jgi:amidohydrolase